MMLVSIWGFAWAGQQLVNFGEAFVSEKLSPSLDRLRIDFSNQPLLQVDQLAAPLDQDLGLVAMGLELVGVPCGVDLELEVAH